MILHKHTAFTFDKKSHSHSRQWKTKRCSGGCRRDSDSASSTSTPPPWSSSAVTVPCRIYPLRFCLSKPNRPSSPTPTQCLIRAARHPNLQSSKPPNLQPPIVTAHSHRAIPQLPTSPPSDPSPKDYKPSSPPPAPPAQRTNTPALPCGHVPSLDLGLEITRPLAVTFESSWW